MPLGLDRTRRAGRWLEWKVRIFSLGAVLALGGIYLERRWLTATAIAVLLAGAGLRFLPGGRVSGPTNEEDGDSGA